MCFLRIFGKKKKSQEYEIKGILDKNQFINFIYKWNVDNPIDRWWREKHGIAFNSPEHRISCFIDQFMEYQEDKIYDQIFDKIKDGRYDPKKSNYLKEQKEKAQELTNEDYINAFLKAEDKKINKNKDG
jgi:hypothetical protein